MKHFFSKFICLLFLLTASPGLALDNYALGLSAYKKGDFRSSLSFLLPYIKHNADPRAFYLIGYAYYELGNYADAIQYFQDAYMLDTAFNPSMEYLKGINQR